MGRLANLALIIGTIGAAAGTYVAFKPQIDQAWGQVTNAFQTVFKNGKTPAQLTCKITSSATSGPSPLKVSFAANPAGGTAPYKYAWDYGDGSTDSSATPDHTFQNAGTMTVKVIVTDAKGETAADFMDIAVGSITPPPPNPNPPQQSTPPFTVNVFNVTPNPVVDGAVFKVAVQVLSGSGNFSGVVDFGNDQKLVLQFDQNGNANVEWSYNLSNTVQKTLAIALSVIDNITQQNIIKRVNLDVLPLPQLTPPPPGTGLNIVLGAPNITPDETDGSFIIDIVVSNKANTPNQFLLLCQVLDVNGSVLSITRTQVVVSPNGSTPVEMKTPSLGQAYVGKTLGIQLFAWDNLTDHVVVGNEVSVQSVL